MDVKITAVEQAWLDGFNNRFNTNYVNGEVMAIATDKFDIIKRNITQFNRTIAQGNAIDIIRIGA